MAKTVNLQGYNRSNYSKHAHSIFLIKIISHVDINAFGVDKFQFNLSIHMPPQIETQIPLQEPIYEQVFSFFSHPELQLLS